MSGDADRPARAETEWPGSRGRPRRDALAVAAFLAGPVAFSLDLAASYFLVPRAHATGSKLPLQLVTAVAAAVLAAGAWAGVRVLRAAAAPPGAAPDRTAERARFLALGGLVLCAFFLGVLGAELVPKLLLGTRD